jgi:hypothetical protein
MGVVLGILLVLAAIAGIAWLAYLAEKKRREALRAWAAGRGFSFDPEKRGDPSLPFSPFGKGHSRYSRHHAEKALPDGVPGLEGGQLGLFEYHYAITRNTGKSSSTQHFWFTCALMAPGLDLGRVQIRDETWGDKLVQAIGFDDIDFEDAEFSKKFVVTAEDRRQAYALLDHALMSWLCVRPGWQIETSGPMLLVFKRQRVSPAGYDAIVDFAVGFLRQIPRILVNAERARRGLPPSIDAGNAAPSSRAQRPRT